MKPWHVAIVGLLILALFVFKPHVKQKVAERAANVQTDDPNPRLQGCEGTGPVNMTSPPRRLEDIEMIEPLGLVIDNHVTPIDHQYYYPPGWSLEPTPKNMRDVLAPADGVVLEIQEMPAFFSHATGELGDYNFNIYHTCTFYTQYIHLNKLSDKLQKTLKNREITRVKAGEVIGQANSFDFSVHNEDVTLPGFIVPEHYRTEPWKIHTVDPYDYFSEPVRSQLLTKNLRQVEPRGGKIDYDIEGTIRGNWFVQGTNGYAGIQQPEYWVTHLSILPDALDPTHTIISLGNFNGEPGQFGVKGGMQDPATLGIKAGVLKYELVSFEYLKESGKRWDRTSFAKGLHAIDGEYVSGTILLQLIENRKLKVESFPNKPASQVDGFTSNSVIYER